MKMKVSSGVDFTSFSAKTADEAIAGVPISNIYPLPLIVLNALES